MHFRDRTLLRLLDADERASLLTAKVGDQLVKTAFVAQEATVDPVTAVVTRQVTLMPTSRTAQPLEAQLHDMQTSHQWRLAAQVPLMGPLVDADARLDLTLLAGRRGVRTSITEVGVEDLAGVAELDAVDARIVAEDGSLPTEESALQGRRLTSLIAILEDRFETGEQAPLGSVLVERGLTTFEKLQTALSAPHNPLRLDLKLVEDALGPASETAFKVMCVAFVLDRPFEDLASRLAEMQIGMARVAESADLPRPPAGMGVRTTAPALLVFPESALDDADLPGVSAEVDPSDTAGLRTARFTELTARLRHVGIVPVAVPDRQE
ncbi:hypothetical protein [Streptomyces sp. DASNCL29]|uniref:hypothetical protein n=1 Tax=Streptomyces sp. DASNCL29 TaxID=2583819 RepID=UPI00110FBBD7|nr:hypothetical protein [Streptomyces sp. DASNCL29]TMV00052.1 hypothetical protein FGK60_21885 [Streptomyces sp. DASNCL29]